jgi:hypothetical protein
MSTELKVETKEDEIWIKDKKLDSLKKTTAKGSLDVWYIGFLSWSRCKKI